MLKRSWKVAGVVLGVIMFMGAAVQAADPDKAADPRHKDRAAEIRIFFALQSSTTVDFIDEPLVGCVDFFKDLHDIEIQLDRPALEQAGVATDAAVSKQLSGLRFDSALNLILRDLKLDWTIDNEVLLITSPEVAQRNLVTRVYDVGELAMVEGANGQMRQDLDALIGLLTSTIQPESWKDVGGPASITPFELCGASGLVIRHTPKVHRELTELLFDLDRLVAKRKQTTPTEQ